jgi:two-component system cell cycle response regulator
MLRSDPVSKSGRDTTVTDVRKPFPELSGASVLLVIHADDKRRQGSRHLLGPEPVRLGRDPDNEIVLNDDTVSRRHARIEKRRDGWVVMDVGSRNGTLVNERETSGVVLLAKGDRVQIGSTIFKYLSGDDVESDFYEEVYRMMITDNLTQVGNRRHFDDVIEREMSRARRFGRPLSLLLLDIDDFKQVNDRWGHWVGDSVLRDVAGVVRDRVRREDTVARYGGEEFAVILPETDLDRAAVVAKDILEAAAAHVLEYRGLRVRVTVSVGCAELLEDDAGLETLLRRADDRLYAAKHSGKNRVMR